MFVHIAATTARVVLNFLTLLSGWNVMAFAHAMLGKYHAFWVERVLVTSHLLLLAAAHQANVRHMKSYGRLFRTITCLPSPYLGSRVCSLPPSLQISGYEKDLRTK